MYYAIHKSLLEILYKLFQQSSNYSMENASCTMWLSRDGCTNVIKYNIKVLLLICFICKTLHLV